MHRRRSRKSAWGFSRLLLISLTIALLLIGSSTFAQDSTPDSQSSSDTTVTPTDEPTVTPTDTPTDTPTVAVTDELTSTPTDTPAETETATAAPSDTPTETATDAPTETQASPTEASETPTDTATEEATEQNQPSAGRPSGIVSPLANQAVCQIESYSIVGGDPLHYQFSAFDSTYTSYTWDFGDGSPTDTGLTTDHSYAIADDYTVTLDCAGSPDVSDGTASVTFSASEEAVIIAFTVAGTPDNTVTEPTVVVHTTNTGSAGLHYSWDVSRGATSIFSTPIGTTADFDLPLTWTDLGDSGSATLDFTLTVYDTNDIQIGQPLTKSLLISLPPKVDFTVSPTVQELTAGSAAYTITLSQDAHSGPLTSATWTLDADADITPTALPTSGTFTGSYTVTYNDAGAHNIAVTYTGPGGGGYIQRSVVATVASADIAASFTYKYSTANGVISVCYTNTSSGPVVTSKWNFGDGTPLTTDNSTVVCHAYSTTTGSKNVVLTVFNAANEQAQSQQSVNLGSAIVANFTTTPSQAAGIFSGSSVQFTDTSTHGPLTWTWDFGDGSAGSSAQNPTHTYSQAGTYLVRLTVTNATGTAYVEKSFDVQVGAITCGTISGPGFVSPLNASATGDYTIAVTGSNGRSLTYTWALTPGSGGSATPLTTTTTDTSNTLHATFNDVTSFQLSVTVQSDDGASCNTTTSVIRGWAGLECDIDTTTTPGLPNPLYATGGSYGFTATDSTQSGRTVTRGWSVTEDGGQTGTGTSFSWNNVTNTDGNDRTFHIVYTVTPTDDASHPCIDTRVVTVKAWPALVCNVTGNATPVPATSASGEDGLYTYTVDTGTSLAGRTPTAYVWTVGPYGAIQSGQGTASISVKWTAPAGFDGSEPSTVSVSMSVNNTVGAATDSPCANTENVNVTINTLTCDAITGNLSPAEKNFNPLVTQSVTYSPNLSNVHGRTLDFWWEITDAIGTTYNIGVLPTTHTADSLPLTFPNENESYTIVYHAAVSADLTNNLPAENCASAAATITVKSVGQVYYCEAALSGDQTPDATGNYNYNFTLDNANGVKLQYVYTLTDLSQPTNPAVVLYTEPDPGSTANGVIGHLFSLVDLSPYGAGSYNLNVHVTSIDINPIFVTDYACDWDLILTVGKLTVDYSTVIMQTVGHTWDRAHTPIGQQICLTNTSAVIPASTTGTTYSWTINGPSSRGPAGTIVEDDGNPMCFSFSEEITGGPYNVTLNAANDDRDLSGSKSYNFSVYNLQSISIADPGTLFVNSLATFQITGENIDTYSWSLFRLSGPSGTEVGGALATGSGQTPTYTFTDSNYYRLKAVGHGPLEDTKAQIDFQVLGEGEMLVKFLAVPTAGVSPFSVCFTDQSATAAPATLTTWDWDFGDGSAHFNGQTPPCHTYSGAAGTSYEVILTVTNSASTTLQATKFIHLYTLTEANLDFKFVYHAGGEVCFTPDFSNVSNVPPGFHVTSWDFGDGNTVVASDDGEICHTYSATGTTYTVIMHVKDPEDEPHEHEHNVTPPSSPGTDPVLTVTGECGTDRIARFTISNTGGALSDNYTIRNETSGDVLVSGQPVALAAGTIGTPTTIELDAPSTQSGTVSLTLANTPYPDGTIVETENPCNYPSDITVSVTCESNLPKFTVSNAQADGDNPMTGPQTFEIRDSGNNLIVSDSFNFGSGPASEDVGLGSGSHSPYETYTFKLTGTQVVDIITFTDGTSDSLPKNCAPAPQITFTHDCAALSFTISNDDSAGNMVLDQTFTISGNGKTYTSTFKLDAGDSTIIDLTTLTELEPFDPYAGYTLATSGTDGFIIVSSEAMNCARPVVEVTNGCAPLSFTFTASGTDGDMLLPQNFTISGNGHTYTSTFQLDAGDTQVVNLTLLSELVPFDPYGGYTLTSDGADAYVVITSNSMDCNRPQLAVTWQCAAIVSFTISNNGGGDMLLPQDYTVTDDLNNPVLYMVVDQDNNPVSNGSMKIAVGKSITISLLNANPYHTFRLTSDGFAGTFDVSHHCATPRLQVSSDCDKPGSFTIKNTGGDMLTAHTFQLTQKNGTDVTPLDNTFMLLHDWKTTVYVPDGAERKDLKFSTDDLGVKASDTIGCGDHKPHVTDTPPLPPAVIVTETPIPPAPTEIAAAPTNRSGGYYYGGSSGNFGGLPATTLQQPDWSKAVCGHNCPEFKVYHSDEPGNWNIYRLNSADTETRQYDHHDLTFGSGKNAAGEDIVDMSPSLSPSNEWVAFTSNRDGNSEIYVASTSGDPNSVRRVTFNTLARDVNPAWGPNNFLVFQSTRNGNWDLYAIDMTTGNEYQLTSDPADEINPFWSPDGSRLLFQSNRPDINGVRQWQIYVLDLASGITSSLSDGKSIDVDPQYSNDGMQIVYRTYAKEGDNSVLMLMDRDGRNKRAITQPTEDATNPSWSPQNHYIAYQSNLDGDLDVFIYELATGKTRKLSDNTIPDYAPTWECDETRVVFTSDIEGDPNIYDAEVQPIDGNPILVQTDAKQWTFDTFNDVYPLGFDPKEVASREGQTPMGAFGQQTVFLKPDADVTDIDRADDGARRKDWTDVGDCQ